MALTVQVIFVGLCLATIGEGNADSFAPSPAAITCCMALPPTPTSPCYVTTTAAPIACPFMTTTTVTPTTMTTTTTTEQPAKSTTTKIPNSTSINARQPDVNASSTTTTEAPSTAEVPLRPNFVVVPNHPNHMPVISSPMNYPIAVGVQGFKEGENPSNMFVVPPYPTFNGPQRFVPVVMNPSTGQVYYVVPNPNKGGNSYSQILNVYTQDKNTGGYYWMPAAALPEANNNATTAKTSIDKN
ncbi:unnamed protein product [Parnassius apollo]|uniref:(apollo) hypothetical protein n=1 Tax=Parnassius apollo TaxID=110799 RepID=A0A8S3Y4Y4_PARAO|nr:unnamed protein product [Parnassius apollo]